MKILLVAPLKRKITQTITSSRPRFVFDLASGLVNKGHQISILGTKNSKVRGAKIIPVIDKGFVEMGPFENEFVSRTSFLAKQAKTLERIASKFDVVHNHARPEFFNLFANIKTPILTTIHSQIALAPELDEALSLFNNKKNCYFIAISKVAKQALKKTKVYKVIYNGVNIKLYAFEPKKDDYLLWVGRLAKGKDKKGNFLDTKGVRWAIKLAKASNSKLKLVANVEDIEFFNKDVKPHLSKKIQWIGPISKEQPLPKKQIAKLMGKAKVFLMTINWQEPFGLVMAESMSCGTPVIGFKKGSVPELIKHGKTGFVVHLKEGLAGLKRALKNIGEIKPENCREHVQKNFSLKKMVDLYERSYKEIK